MNSRLIDCGCCLASCSHHLLHGLFTHQGPILTVSQTGACGTLAGIGRPSLEFDTIHFLTKAVEIPYSSLCERLPTMSFSRTDCTQWLKNGAVAHDQSHVRDLGLVVKLPAADEKIGRGSGLPSIAGRAKSHHGRV